MHWLTENFANALSDTTRSARVLWIALLVCAAIFAAAGCGGGTTPPAQTSGSGKGIAGVDAAAITNADQAPGNWMTYGRTYTEQRFSPLQPGLVFRPRHPARAGIHAAGD